MDSYQIKSIPLHEFANKRVLITGHTGFKGSWLSMILNLVGAEVMGYSLNENRRDHLFNKLSLKNSLQHIEGDIRDFEFFKSSVNKFQPEFIFHLAAQAIVSNSYENPKNTFETNILGVLNILEIIRDSKSIKSAVLITSDKCYQNNEWIWGYRENDRLGGQDPYSASKASAEMIFNAYHKSFFSNRDNLGIATTRAGNVIGGGDISENRIIPDCIRAIKNSKPINLRSPNATRPWQHVLEPLSGYLDLALKLKKNPLKLSGSWNFGPRQGQTKTVLEVANNIIDIFNKGEIVIENNSLIKESQLLQLNCEKANQILGWLPRWSVEKSIAKTGNWYKEIMNGESAIFQTKKDIEEYFEELK